MIERPLCDYYNSFQGETFPALDDNCQIVDWLIKRIDEPARIWDLLRAPTLHIDDFRGEHRIEFSLDFGCEWDIEHGLSARFVDFAFVEIA